MRWFWLSISALMFVGACSKPPSVANVAKPKPVVRVVSAVPAISEMRRDITGTVRLKREVSLAFNSGGRIVEVNVREGDRVRAGQVLARLDLTSLEAGAAAAAAQATRADANLKRLAALAVDGWVSKVQLENARAEAASARALVTQTGFDSRYGVIVATTSGIILRRQSEPGQVVAAGTPVLVLGDLIAGFVMQVAVTDDDIMWMRLGQPAVVTLSNMASEGISATVSEIGARGDDATGTFKVALKLPQYPGLRSGLIGKAQFSFDGMQAANGAVSIPVAAVFGARADEGFVYVLDRQSVQIRRRFVTLGPIEDVTLTVIKGLASGEDVVVSGVDRLRDGMVVKRAAS